MRIVYSLGAAVFLSACAASSTPPGGTCATRASTELSALQAAIQTAETSIERGYAMVRQLGADGVQIVDVRVPVNVAKERQTLAGLQARLPEVQAQTDVALAACR